MIVEFADTRPQRESSERVSLEMPEDIGKRFQNHLNRKADAETERGRKTRQAEIEATL